MPIGKEEYPEKVWQIIAMINGKRPPMDEVERNFKAYHKANPHIYVSFAYYATEARNSGKLKGSAWLIVNRMRWDNYISAVDGNTSFKISNDYIALYARMYMESNHCPHFFNTKLRPIEGVRLQVAERLAA